jgi:hypothetical protein
VMLILMWEKFEIRIPKSETRNAAEGEAGLSNSNDRMTK